jgi:hypothetical protein
MTRIGILNSRFPDLYSDHQLCPSELHKGFVLVDILHVYIILIE